jgi:hypothetical protein
MAARAMRIEPGPNQESVWDNPRPPRIQRLVERLEVIFSGCWIADTSLGYRDLGRAIRLPITARLGMSRLPSKPRGRGARGADLKVTPPIFHRC